MSGLKLGDLILDSRRVAYLPSLQALVFVDLHDALSIAISNGLRRVVQDVDSAIAEYNPRCLIFIGKIEKESVINTLIRRWGLVNSPEPRELHFVTSGASFIAPCVKQLLDLWGASLHEELIWGGYRFVEKIENKVGTSSLNLKLLKIVAHPSLTLKVGRLFGGLKLPVFVKGFGRLYVPSLNPKAHTESVLKAGYRRCDLFAIADGRVLPIGKAGGLRSFRSRFAGPQTIVAKLEASNLSKV